MLASQRCRYHDVRDYDCLCTKHVYSYLRSEIQDDLEGLIGTPVKDVIHYTVRYIEFMRFAQIVLFEFL